MVDITLANFERAGRVGRRLRVREEEGRKELLWTSNTLFGRAVAWIKDIFSGSDEKIAATEAFFREIKREYGAVAETAARGAAREKWMSGTPLRKLVGPSIELARATRSAQEKNRRASNLKKAEAFAVSGPRFAEACKSVGVRHDDLSPAQLELADALISFEAAATTNRKIDEPELRTIAEQAALMAHVFDEAAGTIWYDGDTTLDQALRQLVERRPYAAALLGAGALERVRNAAEEILPVIRERSDRFAETVHQRLRKIAALMRLKGEIRELPSDLVRPMYGVSEVDGVHVTQAFKGDWHRQATFVRVEAAESTGKEEPDSQDVLRAFDLLAARLPVVARATMNRDALSAFAEDVGSRTGTEHRAAVRLPAYAVEGKEPDGPLMLTATRHGPDDHVMINATVEANLQNSDKLEDAVQELLSFVRAEDRVGEQDKDRVSPEEDKRIVSQLTRIVHQHLYAGLLEEISEKYAKVAWVYPRPADELRSIALTRNGSSDFVIDVEFGQKSRADSAAEMAGQGAAMPLASDTEHGYLGRMRLSVSRESLKKGEPFVTLLEPIKYEVEYTPDPDALAAVKAKLERALPKPIRGQEDELTSGRIQYRNMDLLGQAYSPGGARAEEAWERAGVLAGEFSTTEKDAIKLLAWDMIERAGRRDGALEPEEVRDIVADAIEDVSSQTDILIYKRLTADSGIWNLLPFTIDAMVAEDPAELAAELERLSKAADKWVAVDRAWRGGFVSEKESLRPKIRSRLGTASQEGARKFVEKVSQSPTMRAFSALSRDGGTGIGITGIAESQQKALARWRGTLDRVLDGVLEIVGEGETADDLFGTIATRASPADIQMLRDVMLSDELEDLSAKAAERADKKTAAPDKVYRKTSDMSSIEEEEEEEDEEKEERRSREQSLEDFGAWERRLLKSGGGTDDPANGSASRPERATRRFKKKVATENWAVHYDG